MKLKKLGLLVAVCSMVYGFGTHPASASADTVREEANQVVTTDLSETTPDSTIPVLAEPTVAPKENIQENSSSQKEDTKKTDSKKTDSKKTDSKKTDTKKTDTKKTDSKKTDAKKTDSKKTDAKKTDAKKEVAKKDTSKKKVVKKSYTASDLRLMASIINCEAGNECFQGKLAVGIVVMNRIKSKSFPNTLKGVIYERNQFSPVRNGSLKRRLSEYDKGQIKGSQWQSCILAAKKTLSGHNTIIKQGKLTNMSGIHFFSVGLANAKFKLGGHKFK